MPMIDTNQLLSLAFTLIANFTNVVEIPHEHVPRAPGDLQRILVGTPESPLDLYLVHRSGDEFWTRGGVVQQYQSPDSYFHLQSATARHRLIGRSTMTSNEVVELATRIGCLLAKTGHPLEHLQPVVEWSGHEDVPFYEVTWPDTNLPFFKRAAVVEIDARSKRPAFVALWAPEYNDSAAASMISNRVCKAETSTATPGKLLPPPEARLPKPTMVEIRPIFSNWVAFRRVFQLKGPVEISPAEVDWQRTFKAPFGPARPQSTLFHIALADGTVFEAIDASVYGHFSHDACFSGEWAEKPANYWKTFVGVPTTTWEEVSTSLNNLLLRRGVPKRYVERFIPLLYAHGNGGVSRCAVRWCEAAALANTPTDLVKKSLIAEFDLASGEIKSIRIDDSDLLEFLTGRRLDGK